MVIERAQVADAIAWASAYGFPLPRLHYKSVIAQVVVSEAYVLREADGGAPLVIFGCFDIDPGQPGEIFFLAPAGGLGRRLAAVCLIARRELARAVRERPAGFQCWVRDDNPRGQRLASALGFEPTGSGAGWQQWRFVHERRGQGGQERVLGRVCSNGCAGGCDCAPGQGAAQEGIRPRRD